MEIGWIWETIFNKSIINTIRFINSKVISNNNSCLRIKNILITVIIIIKKNTMFIEVKVFEKIVCINIFCRFNFFL